MTWQNSAITITTLLPVVGRAPDPVGAQGEGPADPGLGVAVTGAALVLAVALAVGFDYAASAASSSRWTSGGSTRSARATTSGIDGISLPLYVLTFVLSFLCAIYTWRYVPQPGQHEGVPRADAAARDRHGRHVHRLRPDPVLRLLGAGAGPDVLPDRHLGRPTASTPRSSSSCTRCSARCSCCWASWRCTSRRTPTAAHVRHASSCSSSAQAAGSRTRSS